jgi:hypothetical protein
VSGLAGVEVPVRRFGDGPASPVQARNGDISAPQISPHGRKGPLATPNCGYIAALCGTDPPTWKSVT